VANPPSDRTARTRVPIHPDIAARWSPRAFDPVAVLDDEQLTAVLEAARWSATWGGRQPVRFLVGRRGDPTFGALAGVLRRGNSYARSASALILVCADEGDDERTARYAVLDAGAAIANLSVEAVSRGLVIHPMAGFHLDAAQEAFAIPEGVLPLAIVAIGVLGDYGRAEAAVVERDSRPRERLALEQVVFSGRWGAAAF
jgi:nitroreductase